MRLISRPLVCSVFSPFLILLSLLFSGCAPSLRPAARDYSSYESLSESDIESAWRRIEERSLGSASLELTAVVSKGIHREEVRQLVSFRRPEDLRVELFATALNQLTALVIANENGLFSYDAREQRYLFGEASLKNTLSLLSVPFLPEELMLWLCGRALRPPAIYRSQVLRSGEKGEIAFLLTVRDGRRMEFVIDEKSMLLKSFDIYHQLKNEQLFSSLFRYTSEDQKLPTEIVFQVPSSGINGTITHLSARLNPTFRANALFQLQIPDGAEVTDLDDVSDERS